MANLYVSLPVPAGDGVGAWVDVSGMAPGKTISVDGGAFAGALFIESSNDGRVSACPVDVRPFRGGTTSPADVVATLQFMRVRRSATFAPAGAPTVKVAAEAANPANVFGAMAVPAGDGAGAGIDLTAGGSVNTFNIVGPFSGQVFIDISTDAGATWSPAFLTGVPGQVTAGSAVGTNVLGVVAQARVRRVGSLAGAAPVVSVGSGGEAGAGGGFPGYYVLDPENVDNSLVSPGASVLVARGDHVHGLTFHNETPPANVLEPGGAPAAGASLFPARADHVHVLDDGGAGGTVILGYNTAALPSGTPVWSPAPGVALPANNLDAQAADAFAVFTAGKLRAGAVKVADARFTTDGGKPANGAPVYLAAASDDANAGIGKFTAAKPGIGMPPPFFPPPRFAQNVTALGVCLDNSNYDALKTCAVLAPLPAKCDAEPPAQDRTWFGQEMVGFGQFKFMFADGNNAQFAAKVGQTLAIVFSIENGVFTGADEIWANIDGAGSGWYIAVDAGGSIRFESLNPALAARCEIVGVPDNGINCLMFSIYNKIGGGVGVSGCLNGTRFALGGGPGPLTAPGVGWSMDVGGDGPFLFPFTGFTQGGIYSFGMLDRAATDGEIVDWCRQVARPDLPAHGNMYNLPDGFLDDPSLLWQYNARTWDGNTATPPHANAGPAGLPFDFTFSAAGAAPGGISAVGRYQTLRQNVGPLFVDTEPVELDSRALPRTDPGARIAFQVASFRDLTDLAVAVSSDDTDDRDNGACTFIVNGTPQTPVPDDNPQELADGETHWFYLRDFLGAIGAAPYTIELVIPDKVYRNAGSFKSGTCIAGLVAPADQAFQTDGAAARLLMIGSDEIIGHDGGSGAAPMNQSVGTLLRLDYPGRVTCHCMTSGGIAPAQLWGDAVNRDIAPFVKQATRTAQKGNPAATTIWISLGFNDYFFAQSTVAQLSVGYGGLVDQLHAALPAATIYAQRLIQAHYDAIANANGETLAQFNTAISALAGGRPWLHIANARVPNAIAFDPSFRQPTQPAGTTAYKANIKLIIGY